MAVSKRAVITLLLVVLCLACVAAAERQPLFADSHRFASGSRALPQRFQEMVQRRRLAQTGSYGAPVVTQRATGTYGIYGR